MTADTGAADGGPADAVTGTGDVPDAVTGTGTPDTAGTAGAGTAAEGGTFHERLTALAERRIEMGEVRGVAAADPVNIPMIRHWTDAIGDANPLYTDPEAAAGGVHGEIVAPPAMIQVWSMPGVKRSARQVSTPVDDVLRMLDENGHTGVVATNCEQTYHRYVRLGERPVPATRFAGLSGPKRTALGEGYFVTWNVTWYVGEEPVATMLFRVLKFRPREREEAPPPEPATVNAAPRMPYPLRPATAVDDAARTPDPPEPATVNAAPHTPDPPKTVTAVDDAAPRAPYPLRPAVNRDTEFFWEGVAKGELRIQKCAGCGELRHPPGPVCPSCRSADRTYVVAGGEGEVYSYVVHHHPPVPGRETPFVVAVVELPEGVRMVGNVTECASSEVGIGMPVRVTYRQMDDELTLPMWIPREA
ncbi:bifunctional MaoC family dehydratase N-terminal/OB-fold nucleic acid binding domain-containing protein [Streptosporangium sp. 'caverna']|uniref:bifunctional MaoC family dehydratase N-terminal/OB-fold nucleic acid binding domain-containing protein n=1 Tax=Streptosporangium sp. 'caverna' TaxID=2202249 RepID=UPI001EF90937|nr:bifunctional MaoC family dehydratase N-terminal/OB-fold nucleic acid binding domain-containing protein [Streptosporangium sp. 'caverna']